MHVHSACLHFDIESAVPSFLNDNGYGDPGNPYQFLPLSVCTIALQTEAWISSEISINIYKTTRHHITSWDSNLQSRQCEDNKCGNEYLFNKFCSHALSVTANRIHSKSSELLVSGQRFHSYVDRQGKIKLYSEYVALILSWATRTPF